MYNNVYTRVYLIRSFVLSIIDVWLLENLIGMFVNLPRKRYIA